MAAAGAALLDVGGESTRPGAKPVWEGDEVNRVVPVIERLRAAGTPISIDTRKASVMHAALAAGAHLVNDVSALLWDDRALDLVRSDEHTSELQSLMRNSYAVFCLKQKKT